MSPDFSKYPICDADIWVKLCLGDLLPRLFRKHEKLVFADVVEGEILKWGREDHFSYIANEFGTHKECGNILVIEHEVHIESDDRLILVRALQDLGFKHDFKNAPPEKNKGEFVSAIYADHFGIPFMKTNDGAFQEGGNGAKEFPDLIIKNWYQVVDELITNDREKMNVRSLVERESQRMNYHHEKFKEERKKEDMLAQLASKFNKRRL